MFRGGRVSWRYFWGLYARLESVRAKERLDRIAVAEYAALLQHADAHKRGGGLLEATRNTALVRSLDPDLRARLCGLLEIDDRQLDEWVKDEEIAALTIAHMPEAKSVVPELYERAWQILEYQSR